VKLKTMSPRTSRRLFRLARRCKRTAGGLWQLVPAPVRYARAAQ
jgi:hypothetical protein